MPVPDGLTDEELEALAKAFEPGRPTVLFLQRAGFNKEDLPVTHGTTGRDWWAEVNELLLQGYVDGGRARLLALACNRVRANPIFCAGAKRAAIPPDGATLAPYHVMFVGASPNGSPRIRADQELAAIRPLVAKVTAYPAARVEDLFAVREVRPDILHLACHGHDGYLEFEDGLGDPIRLHPMDEAIVLHGYEERLGFRPRGIVINACFSETAANLFSECADVVIGHQAELQDDHALRFAAKLYQVLSTVDDLESAAYLAVDELIAAAPELRLQPLKSGLAVRRRRRPRPGAGP